MTFGAAPNARGYSCRWAAEDPLLEEISPEQIWTSPIFCQPAPYWMVGDGPVAPVAPTAYTAFGTDHVPEIEAPRDGDPTTVRSDRNAC